MKSTIKVQFECRCPSGQAIKTKENLFLKLKTTQELGDKMCAESLE